MDITTSDSFLPKLFKFGTREKLILLSCTLILWVGSLILYLIPGLDYTIINSFSAVRANTSLANFWLFYTKNMVYLVGAPLIIIYILSFVIDKLKPYRLVLLLSIMTLAIGNIMVDPILKDLIARPRPYVTYLDLNRLYFANGFSFPSGHSFQVFAGTLPLIICFLTNDATFKRNWKTVIFALVILTYAITVALSRVIVGVHYLSDVLFGIGFAIILMVFLAWILQLLIKDKELNLQNEKWYGLVFCLMIILYSVFYTG